MDERMFDISGAKIITKIYQVKYTSTPELLLSANNNRYALYINPPSVNRALILYAYSPDEENILFNLRHPDTPRLITYRTFGELVKAPFYYASTETTYLPIVEICLPCECRLEILREWGL